LTLTGVELLSRLERILEHPEWYIARDTQNPTVEILHLLLRFFTMLSLDKALRCAYNQIT